MLAWLNTGLADTVVTKNEVFYIPFAVTSTAAGQMLELFVSGDEGNSWQLYQQQPASAGKFSFRAAEDGEYWFAVRVAAGGSQPVPPAFTPELKVAVDRVKPTLTAFGARTPAGQIVCRWSAEDPHLHPQSISVEYQAAGQTDWAPAPAAALPTPHLPQLSNVTYGNAVLGGITADKTFRVRVSVGDKAGNVSSMEREYHPAALPLIQDAGLQPEASPEELASKPLPTILHGFDAAHPPSPAPDTAPRQQLPTVISSNVPLPHDDGRYGWQPTPSSVSPYPTGKANGREPHDKSMDLWPAKMSASKLPAAPPLAGMAAAPPQSERAAGADQPSALLVSRDPAADSVAQPAEPMRHATPKEPMPVNQRISKSRRFEIDYDLQDLTPGSVHRVEVWYTVDGGRSWRHHGDDEDRQSPYLMQVDEDGLYGIRLLIQTRVGYNVRPPESGESADIWINVDATPPVARITSVEYGKDSTAGQLEIRWDLHDRNLAERPITLLFSDSLSGPWRKVVGDYPNVGHYTWQIDDRAPPRIFFRLEARDKAGNTTIDSPTTPVNNIRAAPRGQIIDVRPAARPNSTTVR